MRFWKAIILGPICLLPSMVHAQELRCTQMFMNQAEKAICASDSLMELDKEMGLVAHRAEKSQPGYRSDQSAFRKGLKQCKADVACLEEYYRARITSLQQFADTLPPPSEAESARLAREDEKAQAKRDAQAWRRDELRQEAQSSMPALESSRPVDSAPSKAGLQSAVPSESDEDSNVVTDAAVEPNDVASVAPTPASSQTSSENVGVNWLLWVGLGFLLITALTVFGFISSAVEKHNKKCGKCGRWDAGHVIDKSSRSYTDYQMRTFEDIKKDARGYKIGSVKKQRQVAVNMTDVTRVWQCAHCQHEWKTISTQRG
jgi:uncharacterized protein